MSSIARTALNIIKDSNSYPASSPWSASIDPEISFPIQPFEKLLQDLGWSEPLKWLTHWLNRGGTNIASSDWPRGIRSDWVWGLGLPLLSEVERFLTTTTEYVLIGISGLPGCGKTSLGHWLEASARKMNWPIAVISLDDFYLPAEDMVKAMKGNPWKVPRGLPGSHSIELIESTIDNWRKDGNLVAPQFDKALRNGLGDRSGWRRANPKVLIIEGWFLGCPVISQFSEDIEINNDFLAKISKNEIEYRQRVQEALAKYQPIWNRFNRLWHLKASQYNSIASWKTQQEKNMLKERGTSLQGQSLDLFIRMIQTSLPYQSLLSINSNVVARVDSTRKVAWVGRKIDEPKDYLYGL
ncbi:uridine kinase [Prochlorococcus sp. MIT 1307]|uniref:uridine kinase n=1 Tax=Prochlorococcus sp. MIT 1307 TaxID=3096219 RepID=UPI002A762FD3|nr:uridine kinase [Prochlorococcus sp. MIT 1307]